MRPKCGTRRVLGIADCPTGGAWVGLLVCLWRCAPNLGPSACGHKKGAHEAPQVQVTIRYYY